MARWGGKGLSGGKMRGLDKICAVAAAANASSLWRQLQIACKSARTVELRLDWLANDAEIAGFLKLLGRDKPRAALIATCRRRPGGGRYSGSIADQLRILSEAVRAGCEWYDLEIESARRCLPELLHVMLGDARQLASAHFFKRMPPNLKRVEKELWAGHPDAIKIAAQCETIAESLKLLKMARGRRDAVAVPMGEVALPARVLALREGSALAYAAVESATASGQLSLEQMKRLYRADKLTKKTRVYGVIGNPISHSLSPVMQNAGFQARGMDAVFLPFLARDLRDFLAAIGSLRIAGFSVTLPHKQAIMRYLSDCDPLAAAIGAVNTVVVRGGGKLYGYNTDYVGVLRALENRIALPGSRVLILGAGGAARAVAFALAQAGATPCICARRPAKAKQLARAAGGQLVERARLRHEFFDAIVNATPVGMYPHAGESPLAEKELNCRLVFDTIYRPRQTKLLQLAARRGIETVSGVEMFVAQGTAQWEIWTGERAPEKIMRAATLKALDARDRAATIGTAK